MNACKKSISFLRSYCCRSISSCFHHYSTSASTFSAMLSD